MSMKKHFEPKILRFPAMMLLLVSTDQRLSKHRATGGLQLSLPFVGVWSNNWSGDISKLDISKHWKSPARSDLLSEWKTCSGIFDGSNVQRYFLFRHTPVNQNYFQVRHSLKMKYKTLHVWSPEIRTFSHFQPLFCLVKMSVFKRLAKSHDLTIPKPDTQNILFSIFSFLGSHLRMVNVHLKLNSWIYCK